MADYRKEMEAAYTFVDDKFALWGIYGNQGAQIILRVAARESHHAVSFGLTVQAGLLSAAIGACVEAFAGNASPLSMIFLNINVPQTRKSQLNIALQKGHRRY